MVVFQVARLVQQSSGGKPGSFVVSRNVTGQNVSRVQTTVSSADKVITTVVSTSLPGTSNIIQAGGKPLDYSLIFDRLNNLF